MSDPIIYCPKCHHQYGLLKNIGFALDALCGRDRCDGTLKAHKPVYAALFLTQESKKELLEVVLPKHPMVYGEHITMAFGRHLREKYPIGEQVEVTVSTVFEDGRGQCVAADPGPIRELFWDQQVPHVTISCAEGVKPFYSMDLMKDAGSVRGKVELKLKTIVDYHPRLKT